MSRAIFRACLVAAVLALSASSVAAQDRNGIRVPNEILQTYVGAYKLSDGSLVKVAVGPSGLIGHDASGNKTPLTPKAIDTFIMSDGVRLQFVKGTDGTISHLVATGLSGSDSGLRVVVARDILEKYVGSYPFSADLIMSVSLENRQLMVQAPGQSKHPLIPESPTTFFAYDDQSDEVAQLEFGTDNGGAYVAVRQNGATKRVNRR